MCTKRYICKKTTSVNLYTSMYTLNIHKALHNIYNHEDLFKTKLS